MCACAFLFMFNIKTSIMINYEMKYRAFQVRNFREIPQIEALSEEEKQNIEIVGNVFPFKVNNYVIREKLNPHPAGQM